MMDNDPRSPEQIKRDKLQEKHWKHFLVIPFPVMMNPDLTLADKVVFGRAYGFDYLFESPTQTAMALGISPNQVRVSKRKLEKLGLLKVVEENPYGKRYEAVTEFDKGLSKNDKGLSEFDNPLVKIKQPPYQNLTTESKEENKSENKEEILFEDKSSNKAQAPGDESEEVQLKEDKPAIYGKPEINEILDLWEEATGFDWHGVRQERFATKNLIAKYGSEATKALVRRVQRARRADDQFAPQIAKPSQLLGKYEKLTALTMWEERQAKAEAKEAEAHAPAYVPEYMRMSDGPRQDYVDVRPSTPEEKAEAHRKAMEIRAKLPFYVPKEQRKAGC